MSVKKVPERKDILNDDKWNLSPLFETDDDWESLYTSVENEMESYGTFKGKLHESANHLGEAIRFHLEISRKIERLYTYAHQKSDEDKSDGVYLGLYQQAISLHSRASEFSSFMTPEIQSIPDETMDLFMTDKAIEAYRFYLEKILRYKPHTRTEEVERILAMSQEMAQGPSQVFGQLDNVDMTFGALLDETGESVELSHGNFITFLAKPDRDIRKKAFFQYYQAYEAHKHSIAAAFSSSIKTDIFYSRARNFENCREPALFDDDVPEVVYDNLIESVKANLSPLFKYLEFRKKALELDTLHFYDTYVPIIGDVDFHLPYEEAVEICTKALAPLGEDYCSTLRTGLVSGWVDRYENCGKRSGAYSAGCYDSPPYILMNYEDENINSLYTLIHEAGHSMHSFYSRQHQPYVDHDYTIFVAEVASTFNEVLLGQYLLDRYKDNPQMRAYILNREIDSIRATLFRQTMFAEYERRVHATGESNDPLTVEALTGIYRELLESYFGSSMEIDEALILECLRIPHFYSAFYVYKYATGISAAIALAKRVLTEGPAAMERYISFLKLGGSKFPLDELLEAGVDMRSPDPIEKAIAHFDGLVERFIDVYHTL